MNPKSEYIYRIKVSSIFDKEPNYKIVYDSKDIQGVKDEYHIEGRVEVSVYQLVEVTDE